MFVKKLSLQTVPKSLSFLRTSSLKRFSEDWKNRDPKECQRNKSEKEEISQLLDSSVTGSKNEPNDWATSPYPDEPQAEEKTREQKPKIDPADTSVLMFPGQGVVKVGQVQQYLKYPTTKDLFEIANEILGYNLLKICLEGPQNKLNQTNFNQPATVVTCLAALEKLREDRPSALANCKVSVGYSVGEITSLIVAGAMTYEDGLKLINARSTSMHYASTKAPQGMMLAYLSPKTKTSVACADAIKWAMNLGVSTPVCRTAAYLYTETKVLAGHNEALDFLQKNAEKYHFRKLTKLPVSGAFHTPLMEPALNAVKNALQDIRFEMPRCLVYSNATGDPYPTEQKIPKLIIKQIVSPVKWEQCLQRIYSRPAGTAFPKTYDIGSNGSMKAILQRINAKVANSTIVI